MARRRRLQAPGYLHHVVSRGNGRMRIFLDDGDYRQFVHLLGEVCEKFTIECWSYCVMPNHYHAALRPIHPNLSKAMQELNSGYAQWWNRKHSTVGHAVQGRFKNPIVQEEAYLFALLRYIALNPVRAGLVDSPARWRWGSYPALTGTEPAPPFLRVSSVLGLFGTGDVAVLRQRFVTHVVLDPAGWRTMEDRLRSNERIVGDRTFKRAVQGQGV